MCGPLHYQFQQCGHVLDSGQVERCQDAYQANNICQGEDGRLPQPPIVQAYAGICPVCPQNAPHDGAASAISESEPEEGSEEESGSDDSQSGSNSDEDEDDEDNDDSDVTTMHPNDRNGHSRTSTVSRASHQRAHAQYHYPDQAYQQSDGGSSRRSSRVSGSVSQLSSAQQLAEMTHQHQQPQQSHQQATHPLQPENQSQQHASGPSQRNVQTGNALGPAQHSVHASNADTPAQQFMRQGNSTAAHLQQYGQPQAQQQAGHAQLQSPAVSTPQSPQEDAPSQSRRLRNLRSVFSRLPKRSEERIKQQRAQAAEHDRNIAHARKRAAVAERAVFERDTKIALAASRTGSLQDELEEENIVRLGILQSLEEYTVGLEQQAQQAGKHIRVIYTECGHEISMIADDSSPDVVNHTSACDQCYLNKQDRQSQKSSRSRRKSQHGAARSVSSRSESQHGAAQSVSSRSESNSHASSMLTAVHQPRIAESSAASSSRRSRQSSRTKQHNNGTAKPPGLQSDNNGSSIATSTSSRRRHRSRSKHYIPSESPTQPLPYRRPAPIFATPNRSRADIHAIPEDVEPEPSIAGTEAVSLLDAQQNRAREEAVRTRLFEQAKREEEYRRLHPEESILSGSQRGQKSVAGRAEKNVGKGRR